MKTIFGNIGFGRKSKTSQGKRIKENSSKTPKPKELRENYLKNLTLAHEMNKPIEDEITRKEIYRLNWKDQINKQQETKEKANKTFKTKTDLELLNKGIIGQDLVKLAWENNQINKLPRQTRKKIYAIERKLMKEGTEPLKAQQEAIRRVNTLENKRLDEKLNKILQEQSLTERLKKNENIIQRPDWRGKQLFKIY